MPLPPPTHLHAADFEHFLGVFGRRSDVAPGKGLQRWQNFSQSLMARLCGQRERSPPMWSRQEPWEPPGGSKSQHIHRLFSNLCELCFTTHLRHAHTIKLNWHARRQIINGFYLFSPSVEADVCEYQWASQNHPMIPRDTGKYRGSLGTILSCAYMHLLDLGLSNWKMGSWLF